MKLVEKHEIGPPTVNRCMRFVDMCYMYNMHIYKCVLERIMYVHALNANLMTGLYCTCADTNNYTRK